VHGGVKFYRGSAASARSYVEADRSRVDDYYLAEGTGVATSYVAGPNVEGGPSGIAVTAGGTLDGDAYERCRKVGCAPMSVACGSSRSW
jgi:exodeoxyribonuclease V alpha subunit